MGTQLEGDLLLVAVILGGVVLLVRFNPVGAAFSGLGGAVHGATQIVGGGFSQLGTTASQSTPTADNINRQGGPDCVVTDPMSGMIVGNRCGY